MSSSKHKDLLLAAQLCGSNSELARRLGVVPTTVGEWINLKNFPHFGCDSWDEDRQKEISDMLLVLTGKSIEELWPPELCEKIVGGERGRRMARQRELAIREMAQSAEHRMTLECPDNVFERNEIAAAVRKAIEKELDERQQCVIRMRHGIQEPWLSLEECGRRLGLPPERIRQIQIRAEIKLEKALKKWEKAVQI